MNVPDVIDFSKPEYSELRNEIAKEIFLFLGAGFSKQVGYKLWDELTDEVINIFWRAKLNGENNLDTFTWSIKEQLSRSDKKYVMDYLCSIDSQRYHKIIESIFKDDEKAIKTDIIDILKPLVADSKCKFIQTNIDKSFQEHTINSAIKYV